MKLDKEFALKHRFWLLLGVFGLLWLTSLVVLLFFIGDPIGDKANDLKAAQDAITPYTGGGAKRPKNDSFLPPWEKYGTTFKNHKNTVWNIAWSGDKGDLDGVDADIKDPVPDKAAARHVYRNAIWEVQLLFDKTDKGGWRIRPESSIKNVDFSRRDQDLVTPGMADGVWFRLLQGDADATTFAFTGDKVAPGQVRTLAEGKQKDGWTVEGNADPTQPMQLQQVVAEPWKGQGGMYTWPGTERYVNGVFTPGEHPLNQLLLNPTREFSEFHRSYYKGDDTKSAYRDQFDTLFTELNTWPPLPARDRKKDPTPVPPPGLPLDPVVFKGSGASKKEDFLTIMNPVPITSVTNTPSPEECWLMQEDFWVKRELLYVLRDAVNLASHMDAVDDAKAPEDATILAHQSFRNASWEVHLLFDRNSDGKWHVRPDSTIKNIHVSHRDQPLGSPASPDGVWFRLRQGNAPPSTIAFEGEPLPWGQQAAMSQGAHKDGWVLMGTPDPTHPMQLEQLFDPTNAPITQIDAIALSQVSHRNANRVLTPAKPERFGQKPAAPAAGAPPAGGASPISANPNAGGTTGGLLPGGTGGPNGSAQGGPMGGDKSAASTKTPNYGLERNRYLFVTDQSRHLPVALTLTVDQSHLHEVLAAFANSRLRFQTTQVEFRRVPAAAGPSSTSPSGFPMENPGPGGTSGPMVPGGPFKASTGGSPPPGSTGPMGGNPNGVGSNPNYTGTGGPPVVADNPNLIEVTIYGIASLYERPETTVKGKVKTAGRDRITITGEDNKDRDLAVGDAKVVIDGKDGKAEDLKKDSAVTVTLSADQVIKIETGAGVK